MYNADDFPLVQCRNDDERQSWLAWQGVKAEIDTQALNERLRRISVVEFFGAPGAPLHLAGDGASAARCADCFAHDLCKTLLLVRIEKHAVSECIRNTGQHGQQN